MQKWIILGAFLFAMIAGVLVYSKFSSHGSGPGIEVTWDLLGQLDFVTGSVGEELKLVDGAFVKVPGFMVPLEDEQKNVVEFLLVPTPQACIHVPPPPPNQMVYVKMNNNKSEVAYGPIWVYGTLKITNQKHQYGEASFVLTGERFEPYR